MKRTLRRERVKEQVAAFVDKLKQQIPIWTAFDGQTPVASNDTPPQDVTGSPVEFFDQFRYRNPVALALGCYL